MTAQLIRVASGLILALLTAAILKFALFDIGFLTTSNESEPASVSGAFIYVLIYALPFAVLAALATEAGRLRSIVAHVGLGILAAFLATFLWSRGTALTSPVFAGGTLTALKIVIAGALSSLVYWFLAGRKAGWRGETVEKEDAIATEAFRTASAKAQVEHCRECLVVRSALGTLAFLLLSWFAISTSGLRDWLVSEAGARGKEALATAGYDWATFRVENNRGVVEGLAPDEVQKRAAYDSVREALHSVTGFPGILAKIDNEAVARMPMAEVSQQLADATRREKEAQAAVEAARIAAEAARAAEAEAKRKAEERVATTEAEIKRKAEEQAAAVEAEFRRKAAEQALATEAEYKRRAEEQAAAAETEIKRRASEQAVAIETEMRRKAELQAQIADQEAAKKAAAAAAAAAAQPPPAQEELEVAAVEPPPTPAEAPDAEAVGATPATVDTSPDETPASCTAQDLAIIEGSRVLFDLQRFDVRADYEQELTIVANSARACAHRAILVSGYADPSADSLFNPALALQRANSIRNLLVERGVPATRVIAESAIAAHENDNSPEARMLNRRAVFKLVAAADVSRDVKLDPEERATTCESDLSTIMSQSIIHFPMASSRVSDESMGLIRKLAGAIMTCGSVIVTVEGHTDKLGGANYNQGLSEARANAVKEALMAAGADPTRLASKGFAASRPYDPADTAEAFALNRRIEFKVSGKFTSTNAGGP